MHSSGELATLKANAAHFEEQKRLLLTAQELLKREFENGGGESAGEGAGGLPARGAGALHHSKRRAPNEKIKALLAPVDRAAQEL
jgi:DNA recombination protein RmuC